MNRIAANMKKTAERKGWLSAPEKIKTAAREKKSFNPLQPAFQNITILSQELRAAGLNSEAQVLENKILEYKLAENKLYNLIDRKGEDWIEFAHPEGSPKLFDSQEKEGIVETSIDQQIKMRDMVLKNPKKADKKLAQILGIKIAQQAAQEEIPAVSQEDLEEITVSEEMQAKIASINSFLSESWPEIGNSLRAALQSAGIDGEGKPTAAISFNPKFLLSYNPDTKTEGGLNYLDFFTKYSKVSASELKEFVKLYQMLYGQGEFNPQVLAGRLLQINNYSGLKSLVAKIDAELATKYFYGSTVEKEKVDEYDQKVTSDERLIVNPSSVWAAAHGTNYGSNFYLNKDKISEAAAALHGKLQAVYDRLITNNLGTANQSLAGEILSNLVPLANLISTKNKVNFSVAPMVTKSTGFVTSALLNAQDVLARYSAKGDLGKTIYSLLISLSAATKFGDVQFFGNIQNSNAKMETVKQFLSDPNNILNPQVDAIPPKATYQGIAQNFRLSAQRLNSYLNQLKEQGVPENDKNYQKYSRMLNMAVGAFKLANSGINQPFGTIIGQVQKLFPKTKIKDISGFQSEGDSWVQGTAMLAPPNKTSQERKNMFHKSAGFDDYDSSAQKTKNVPVTNKPAEGQKQPSPGQQQSGGAKITEEEKSAVQNMQLSLFTLGQYMKAYGEDKVPEMKKNIAGIVVALIRTGPGIASNATKNQFDGFWGPNTANALKAAESVRLAWNKTSPRDAINDALTIGPSRGEANTIPNADKNSEILVALIRMSFGGQVNTDYRGQDGRDGKDGRDGQNQERQLEYDRLPDQLNETTLNVLNGRHPLTNYDLYSLPALYDFLTENGIEKPEFYNETEGWTAAKWQALLDWLAKRSQALLETSDRKNKPNRLAYRRAVNELMRALNAYLQQTGTKINQIIPIDALRNAQGNSGPQRGGDQGGRRGDGSGQGNNGKGNDGSRGRSGQNEQFGRADQYSDRSSGWSSQSGGFSGRRQTDNYGSGNFPGQGSNSQGQGAQRGGVDRQSGQSGNQPNNRGTGGQNQFPGGTQTPGIADSGRQLRRPAPENDEPPIGEVLDFRHEFWTMNYQDLPYPILKLSDFRRTDVATLSQMLFAQSNNQNPQSDYGLLLRSGFEPQTIRWNGQDFEIYLSSSDGQYYWFPLQQMKKIPWFIQRFPVLAAKDKSPIDQLEIFLLQLTKSLHATAQNWSGAMEPTQEELSVSLEYSKRWQKAIQQKLRQIQHWRSQRG